MIKNPRYILYTVGAIVIIATLILMTKNSKKQSKKQSKLQSSSYSVDTNFLTKSMLEEMNTDVGIKTIQLNYCEGGCNIGLDEKSIYDCEYQDYLDEDWSQCSQSCGDSGVRTRNKRVLFDFGGNCSSTTPPTQTEACNRIPCPVDCVLGEWEEWSSCSEPCDDGVKMRTRPVLTPAQYGGAVCPDTSETSVCNNGSCCTTTDWSSADEGWQGTGCMQSRTNKKIVNSYYPDLTGCPVGDIELQSRNSCNISLPGGVLEEGKVYSYSDVNNLLGSQSDINIPSNTELVITLNNNIKYVTGSPKILPVDKKYLISYEKDNNTYRYYGDRTNFVNFRNTINPDAELYVFNYLSDQTISLYATGNWYKGLPGDIGNYGKLIARSYLGMGLALASEYAFGVSFYNWTTDPSPYSFYILDKVELFNDGQIRVTIGSKKYKVVMKDLFFDSTGITQYNTPALVEEVGGVSVAGSRFSISTLDS
jgi:hypothetical protein